MYELVCSLYKFQHFCHFIPIQIDFDRSKDLKQAHSSFIIKLSSSVYLKELWQQDVGAFIPAVVWKVGCAPQHFRKFFPRSPYKRISLVAWIIDCVSGVEI